MSTDLKQMYKTIMDDHFPPRMEISFIDEKGKRQTLFYEKVSWVIENVRKGLRYGENPGQEAAIYKLVNGNLILGETETILPGQYLVSDMELLQSGKHLGKINLTDADNALNILRYFSDQPAVIIVKHNNPCGAAISDSLLDAYQKAYMADSIAAFGGCIAVNRSLDKLTAEAIASQYTEVVVAPDFEDGALDILAKRKNLRIIRIKAIEKLQSFVGKRYVEFKNLIDGGIIAQWSFVPQARRNEDFVLASCEYKGKQYIINRPPTPQEFADIRFGWLLESGITSNSVIYVKNGVSVGIGTGQQDRFGVAVIALFKAHRNICEMIALKEYRKHFSELDVTTQANISSTNECENKLVGATMVSDAFFPFRDGVDVGLQEGITAIVQSGGSLNDYQSIEACNEYGATMVFTGQRSFKH